MCSNLVGLTLLLCIHIALRPDKSGFKTGAQALTLPPFYRHIAPLERRFLSNHKDFRVLGLLKECESGSSSVCSSIFPA